MLWTIIQIVIPFWPRRRFSHTRLLIVVLARCKSQGYMLKVWESWAGLQALFRRSLFTWLDHYWPLDPHCEQWKRNAIIFSGEPQLVSRSAQWVYNPLETCILLSFYPAKKICGISLPNPCWSYWLQVAVWWQARTVQPIRTMSLYWTIQCGSMKLNVVANYHRRTVYPGMQSCI